MHIIGLGGKYLDFVNAIGNFDVCLIHYGIDLVLFICTATLLKTIINDYWEVLL